MKIFIKKKKIMNIVLLISYQFDLTSYSSFIRKKKEKKTKSIKKFLPNEII